MTLKEHLVRTEKAIDEITEKTKKQKQKVVVADIYSEDKCVEVPAATVYDVEYINQRVDWIREDINSLRETFYSHLNGHLPALTPSALEKALELFGLGQDYVVQKKTIWASDGNAVSTSFLVSPKG